MGLRRRIARARLAARVMRRLRRAGASDVHYDARAFVVRFRRGDETTPTVIPLDQVRRGDLDRFVAEVGQTPHLPATWAEARPLLRTVLRNAVPQTGITRPVTRAALPYLSEFVVVDHPETMTYVTPDQLTTWAVTPDEVFAAARANLTGAVLHGVATEPTVVRFVDDGDAYWTSHLLLDGWLARLSEQVGGRPVAFAPERGTLIVTADGSRHLPELFARAEIAYLTSPRAISPMAYVSDDARRTVPYPAGPGHPLHDCVRRARAVQAMQEYARQAETLPGAAPLELADGGRTCAVADAGELLPYADEVRVKGTVVPWSRVGTEPVPGLDPPRFRLTERD